jgi:RNA recognition motif-containing protein
MDIFVDNLPLDLTDDILVELFGIYGEVTSATVMRSGRTGEAIGMAMVSMREPEQAQVAVEKLNHTVMDGEPIVVSRFSDSPSVGHS